MVGGRALQRILTASLDIAPVLVSAAPELHSPVGVVRGHIQTAAAVGGGNCWLQRVAVSTAAKKLSEELTPSWLRQVYGQQRHKKQLHHRHRGAGPPCCRAPLCAAAAAQQDDSSPSLQL
jgi:hypothetical protein